MGTHPATQDKSCIRPSTFGLQSLSLIAVMEREGPYTGEKGEGEGKGKSKGRDEVAEFRGDEFAEFHARLVISSTEANAKAKAKAMAEAAAKEAAAKGEAAAKEAAAKAKPKPKPKAKSPSVSSTSSSASSSSAEAPFESEWGEEVGMPD